jgi:hypothetical protein
MVEGRGADFTKDN